MNRGLWRFSIVPFCQLLTILYLLALALVALSHNSADPTATTEKLDLLPSPLFLLLLAPIAIIGWLRRKKRDDDGT